MKISDFGLSTVYRHMGKERKLSKRCGTPPYIAPEVLGVCACVCVGGGGGGGYVGYLEIVLPKIGTNLKIA